MGLVRDALKYPFKRWGRMLYYWWNLVPVLGWMVYGGYLADVARSVARGRDKELPAFNDFWKLVRTGFCYLAISLIVALAANVLSAVPFVGWALYAIALLLLPVMLMQFVMSRKFLDGLDFIRAARLVLNNLGAYALFLLRVLVLAVVWLVASIPLITLIITVPAVNFGTWYLIAVFYREAVKKQR